MRHVFFLRRCACSSSFYLFITLWKTRGMYSLLADDTLTATARDGGECVSDLAILLS